MIRRTLTALAAALVAAFTLVVALPIAAQAAHVTPGSTYINLDPEEKAKVKITTSLNYVPSRSFHTAESVSVAVSPWGYDEMSCRGSVIDKVRANVAPIGQVNPVSVTKECRPGGVVFYIDFPNQVIWHSGDADRCTYVRITFIRGPFVTDKSINTRSMCLPRS